ncbi:hypothetical protein G3480_25680 [Thiorhodococcus mannitoliphagus]|uniref:Uncharacterized protein n=2 Tax=Thiorhodococcus mannitoliphagus TaxID=329406 RepID=A0A6P1E809_9GAMM|nr:hypothetical protein [Thiorhodococcus mannitoliphagus]
MTSATSHELVVDLQLAAYCVSKRELVIAHLEIPQPEALPLYDRNYCAFCLMVTHAVHGADFCMHLARDSFSAAESFWDSDAHTTIITLTPSRDQTRDCRNQDLPTDAMLFACAWCGCACQTAKPRSWPPRSSRRNSYRHACL